MSKTARTVLLLTLVVIAVLFAPFYMGHLLGGITAVFVTIGVALFLLIAGAGAVIISAAGILAAFIAVCVVLLVALSPVLVPLAIVAGFVWLIVKLTSRRPTPPDAPPSAPATLA